MASQGWAGPLLQPGLEGHTCTTQMSWVGVGVEHKPHLMGGWDGGGAPPELP